MKGDHVVGRAVLHLLCFGSRSYDQVNDYGGRDGVGGLFSQLNFLAQEVLERMFIGTAPGASWHASTHLHGYGGGSLADHFHAIPCPAQPQLLSIAEALTVVVGAPRHLVVSHLLHALYRPRAVRRSSESSSGPIDLAMHVRRGDKITEERSGERIKIWDETALLEEVGKYIRNGTVLIASDDDAFSKSVAERLEGNGYTALRHGNDHQTFDAQNKSVEAALVCDASCVTPLLSLMQQFTRARTIILSTKSNLGSFLLSYWFAANNDETPGFVDLDKVVTSTATFSRQGRYFCVLPWGSRRGLCKSNQTTCDLPGFAQRAFCLPKSLNKGRGKGKSQNGGESG